MIDEKKLIEDIRKYADLKHYNGEVELANGILKSLSIIENQPQVNQWIPASQRLPEDRFNENGEPVEYSVMLRRATEPTTLSIDEHGKWFDWRGHYYNIASLMAYEFDVMAWQPLPEKYKEESE